MSPQRPRVRLVFASNTSFNRRSVGYETVTAVAFTISMEQGPMRSAVRDFRADALATYHVFSGREQSALAFPTHQGVMRPHDARPDGRPRSGPGDACAGRAVPIRSTPVPGDHPAAATSRPDGTAVRVTGTDTGYVTAVHVEWLR